MRGVIELRQERALTVQRTALLYDSVGAYVFVVRDGRAHRVTVVPDLDGQGVTGVKGALKAGDVVVVQGNYELQDGVKVEQFFMQFHDWAVRHRRSLLFLVVLAILGGAASILNLPVSLFPHVSFPRVEVSVDAGVRPAPQMEIEVTRKLEQALRSVRFVRNVRSTTSRGSADISVDFDWGNNMPEALLEVEAQIGLTLPQLPKGTTYTVRRMDPVVFPGDGHQYLVGDIKPD